MPLDREIILAAALELVDERGLDGFTLRALGERLGVSPMAAYRHFQDKSAIIDALADRLLAEIRLDDPEGMPDAEERILSYTKRARQVLLAHPALVPVVTARPLMRTDRANDLIELHRTFAEAGFPDDFIVEAVLSLVSTTLGLILYHQQRSAYDRSMGPSYHEDRVEVLTELQRRPDAPKASIDLLVRVLDGTWGEFAFDAAIGDCYEGLRRRAGLC